MGNRTLRNRVLDELDWAYDEIGRTPDLMFVSSEQYTEMDEKRQFEVVRKDGSSEMCDAFGLDSSRGYLGMFVIEVPGMDDAETSIILTDWESVRSFFPQAKDFYSGRT